MDRQQNLFDFFQIKKVKLQQSQRLVTPIMSDDEDQLQESGSLEIEDRESQQYSTKKFSSPFSLLKTTRMTTFSDFGPQRNISKLEFPQSPFKNLLDFNFIKSFPRQELQDDVLKNSTNSCKKNGSLDKWCKKKSKNNSWPNLPKEIVYKVFSYLNLSDCANASIVCRYWKVCYHNIYFCYSFLKEFDSDRYSEREMATVFKKAGSKMKHIRKIRDILKGQKLGPLMQRARVSALLSQNSENQGSLFQEFRLEPKKQQSSVFLTDKALLGICSDSNQSLQFMTLTSCQLVTGCGFEGLRKCQNLQYLNIQNNSHLTDTNLEIILKELSVLHTLMLAKCSGLTGNITSIISLNCPKIERLDLGANPQIRFDKIKQLENLKNLGSFSVRQTSITNSQLQELLISIPQLHSLNISGCVCINNFSLGFIRQHGNNLIRINIKSTQEISEPAVFELVEQMPKLKVLLINGNLLSRRIEGILALH